MEKASQGSLGELHSDEILIDDVAMQGVTDSISAKRILGYVPAIYTASENTYVDPTGKDHSFCILRGGVRGIRVPSKTISQNSDLAQ